MSFPRVREKTGRTPLLLLLLPFILSEFPASLCEDPSGVSTPPRFSLSSSFGYEDASSVDFWKDLQSLRDSARIFEQRFKGRLAAHLPEALARLETLTAAVSDAVSLAALAADADLSNEKRQRDRTRVEQFILTEVTPHLVFFDSEASGLSDDWLSIHLKTSPFIRSRTAYLSLLRLQRRHFLSPEIEALLQARRPAEAQHAAAAALKQQLAAARVKSPFLDKETAQETERGKGEGTGDRGKGDSSVWAREGDRRDGKGEGDRRNKTQTKRRRDKSKRKEDRERDTVSLAKAQAATQHPSQAVRKRALEAVDQAIRSQRLDVLATVSLNAVAGMWGVENEQRNYPTLRSKRNLLFGVSDSTVSAMIPAVREEGPSLAQRFYSLKRQILKRRQKETGFHFSDRLAPVSPAVSSRVFTWPEAVSLLDSAFSSYLPFCATEFQRLQQEGRLDAHLSPNKRQGSYTRPGSPDTGPFVVLNFEGTLRDVRSLAREATHACLLSLRAPLGPLLWASALALSETAARLGERIITETLRAQLETPEAQLAYLMEELDYSVNAILRQISYDRFEELAHEAREEGLLFPEQLNSFWIQATEEMFGPPGTVFDTYGPIGSTWASVPHFHSLPFGVYLFALCPLAAEILCRQIEKDPKEAQQRLVAVLAANRVEETEGETTETKGRQKEFKEDKEDSEGEVELQQEIELQQNHEQTEKESSDKTDPEEKDDPASEGDPTAEDSTKFRAGYGDDPSYEGDDPPYRDDVDPNVRKLDEEPLLFNQLFEALGVDLQDVEVWKKALKSHLGALLEKAEALAEETIFSVGEEKR